MDQFNTPWRVTAAAIYTTPTDSRVNGTFDHRIVGGAQIGKLARGIRRNFRKVAWLDTVPEEELRACIFATRT